MAMAKAECNLIDGAPVIRYQTRPGFSMTRRVAPDVATLWGQQLSARVFDIRVAEGKKYSVQGDYRVDVGKLLGLRDSHGAIVRLLLDLEECWNLAGQLMNAGHVAVALEVLEPRVELTTPLGAGGGDGCDVLDGYSTFNVRIAN